jgi:hypothetical protein
LTEKQLSDIERRDKLQRLRGQETNHYPYNQNATVKRPSEPLNILPQTIIEQESSSEETSSAPDLLKDHIDRDHIQRQKKV